MSEVSDKCANGRMSEKFGLRILESFSAVESGLLLLRRFFDPLQRTFSLVQLEILCGEMARLKCKGIYTLTMAK